MQSINVFAMLFESAHAQLEAIMTDVTDGIAHQLPLGVVSSIGAQYVHAVTSEDNVINGLLKGSAPLNVSSFADRIGSAEVPQPFVWGEWGRSVKVDVAQAKAYAQAVYTATQTYVASLTPEALGEIVDLSAMGMGQMPRAALLNIALQQILSHSGEISALKGLQGLKGYPN